MAALALPEPGTELGPCTGDCQHTDCAETREMAAAQCRICEQPIGYGKRMYVEDGDQSYVHAACLEQTKLLIAQPSA